MSLNEQSIDWDDLSGLNDLDVSDYEIIYWDVLNISVAENVDVFAGGDGV